MVWIIFDIFMQHRISLPDKPTRKKAAVTKVQVLKHVDHERGERRHRSKTREWVKADSSKLSQLPRTSRMKFH